jgi:YHS domain-containing protein/thioredoxin-related protein
LSPQRKKQLKETVGSMCRIPLVITVGLMLWSLPNATLASIAWLSDLRQAQQIAHEQQRVVLVHFFADWCSPCVHLEREVYPRAEISAAISANFVPVKVDVRRSPELVRHYGVQSFPTDIFLDPSGGVLLRTNSPTDPGKYLQMLNQMAPPHSQSPQQTPLIANSPAHAPAWSPNPRDQRAPHQAAPHQAAPHQTAPRQTAPQAWQPQNAHHAAFHNDPYDPRQARGASGQQPSVPLTDPPTPPPAAPEPKLALEGFCPVTLSDKDSWVPGDRRWGAIHRGRVYLFASPSHQKQFLDDPDRYSPVLSGYDPTRFIDRGEPIEGNRQHGMWFRGRMYLFAEEASLERFQRSPEYYAQKSYEIMMRGSRR